VFEVVVVSRDRDAGAFRGGSFPEGAPWFAIPFESKERDGTANKYAVPGIPTLTIVKANGDVIALEGDCEIEKGMEALEGWKAKM